MVVYNINYIFRNYIIGDIMELEVLERANHLRTLLPIRSKEECLKQAISDLKADKYIEDNARMFDILIADARADFERNILAKII